jgi:DNA-directed RNA polymerase specialized sigma subunit
MGYNLYSLSEEELRRLCVEGLFDRRDTKILVGIILEEKAIKVVAAELGISEQAVYRRISKMRRKLNIRKWTDSLV